MGIVRFQRVSSRQMIPTPLHLRLIAKKKMFKFGAIISEKNLKCRGKLY